MKRHRKRKQEINRDKKPSNKGKKKRTQGKPNKENRIQTEQVKLTSPSKRERERVKNTTKEREITDPTI